MGNSRFATTNLNQSKIVAFQIKKAATIRQPFLFSVSVLIRQLQLPLLLQFLQ